MGSLFYPSKWEHASCPNRLLSKCFPDAVGRFFQGSCTPGLIYKLSDCAQDQYSSLSDQLKQTYGVFMWHWHSPEKT